MTQLVMDARRQFNMTLIGQMKMGLLFRVVAATAQSQRLQELARLFFYGVNLTSHS